MASKGRNGSAWLVAICLCLFASGGSTAQAESNASDAGAMDAEYQGAIGKALQEYDLGHWAEAKVYFERAHALQPSARTLRGLGNACYELRLYVEAIAYFQQSLTSSVRPLTAAMRETVSAALRDAEHFVSHMRIEVEPKSALLEVDGRPARKDAEGRIVLDPGPHELTARATGFVTITRRTGARGGDEFELVLRLQPAKPTPDIRPDAAPLPSRAPQTTAQNRRRTAHPVPPWIVVGASAAVAVTGAVLLGLALSDRAQIEHPSNSTWSAADQNALDRVPAQSAIGVVALSVGAAGVAAGLAWRFWSGPNSDTAGASLRVSPGAVRVTGRF